MKRTFLAVMMLGAMLSLAGCGGGGGSPSTGGSSVQTFTTQIFSDPVFDGDIEETAPSVFTITQGMSPTVQSVFAGVDPGTLSESRAFLDFPLRSSGGVPSNAIIQSASLEIFVHGIQPVNGVIPIRIELVSFLPPTLLATDYDRTAQPALAFTTIVPSITSADAGQHVSVDVTPLMVQAQNLGLSDFQVRIMEDVGIVSPGLIEIDDATGANRGNFAPLITVTYR